MRPAVCAACLLSAVLGQTGCDPYPRAGHLADAFPPPTVEPTIGILRSLPRPIVAGLVWLKTPSGDPASTLLPDTAVRRILANAVAAFNERGDVFVTRLFLPSDLPEDLSWPALRKLGEASGLNYLLVILPGGRDRRYPVRLRVDRAFHFPGMRRDLFLLLEGGVFDVQSEQFLFLVAGRGAAVLEQAAAGFEDSTSRFPQVYRWAFGDLHFGIRYPGDAPEIELGVLAGELALAELVPAIGKRVTALQRPGPMAPCDSGSG